MPTGTTTLVRPMSLAPESFSARHATGTRWPLRLMSPVQAVFLRKRSVVKRETKARKHAAVICSHSHRTARWRRQSTA